MSDIAALIAEANAQEAAKWAASSVLRVLRVEDSGAGTKYVLKGDGVRWVMTKKTYSDLVSVFEYARSESNSGVTIEMVWAQRETLIYGY